MAEPANVTRPAGPLAGSERPPRLRSRSGNSPGDRTCKGDFSQRPSFRAHPDPSIPSPENLTPFFVKAIPLINNAFEALEKTLAVVERENVVLSKQLKERDVDHDAMVQENRKLHQRIQKIGEDIQFRVHSLHPRPRLDKNARESDVKQLKEELSQLMGKHTALEDENQLLTKETSHLEVDLTKALHEVDQLSSHLVGLQIANKEEQRMRKVAEDKAINHDVEKVALSDALAERKQALDSAAAKVATLKEELLTTETAHRQEVVVLLSQLQEAWSKVVDLESQLGTTNEQVTTAQAELGNKKRELAAVEEQNAFLISENRKLQKRVYLVEEVERKKVEVDEVIVRIEDVERRKVEVDEVIVRIEAEAGRVAKEAQDVVKEQEQVVEEQQVEVEMQEHLLKAKEEQVAIKVLEQEVEERSLTKALEQRLIEVAAEVEKRELERQKSMEDLKETLRQLQETFGIRTRNYPVKARRRRRRSTKARVSPLPSPNQESVMTKKPASFVHPVQHTPRVRLGAYRNLPPRMRPPYGFHGHRNFTTVYSVQSVETTANQPSPSAASSRAQTSSPSPSVTTAASTSQQVAQPAQSSSPGGHDSRGSEPAQASSSSTEAAQPQIWKQHRIRRQARSRLPLGDITNQV